MICAVAEKSEECSNHELSLPSLKSNNLSDEEANADFSMNIYQCYLINYKHVFKNLIYGWTVQNTDCTPDLPLQNTTIKLLQNVRVF